MPKYGWLLIASFVLLQPVGNTFELPIVLMAFSGLWLTLRHWSTVKGLPAFKPLMVVFACVWVPMLLSLTDAVNLSRAAQTSLVFLRFPFAAVFVSAVLATQSARDRVLMLVGLGTSLAALAVVGLTLTGHAAGGRVNASFPIGHIMAVLSPIYLYWLWRTTQQRWWLVLVLPVYAAAILFSGARVAWIMVGVGSVLVLIQLLWVEKIRWRWKTAAVVLAITSLGIGATVFEPGSKAKLAQTAGLFSGNYEKTNMATSLRLPIWGVAVRMAKDHWINGVGPRGFRYVYEQYAEPGNPFMVDNKNRGATHPHQLLLEVVTETGIIGLLGYLIALGYWLRLAFIAARARQGQALPWMAGVLVAIMPINAHMAFYASFWSCITWWLIALSLAYWQAGVSGEKTN